MLSDNFERKLRDKFADAQITPRPEMWDQIEQGLAKKKSRRGGFFWLFGEGLLALSLLFFMLYSQGPTIEDQAIDRNILKASIVIPAKTPCSEEAEDYITKSAIEKSPVAESTNEQFSSAQNHSVQKIAPKADNSIEKRKAPITTQSSSLIDIPLNQAKSDQLTSDQSTIFEGEQNNPGLSAKNLRLTESIAIGSKLAEANQDIGQEAKKQSIVEKRTLRDISFSGSLPYPSYLLEKKIVEEKPGFETLSMPGIRRWGFYGFVRSGYGFRSEISVFNSLSAQAADFTTYDNTISNANNPLSGQYQSIRFPRWNTRVGMGVEYFLHRNFSVQSGLTYSASEYGYFLQGSIDPSSLNTSAPGAIVVNQESLNYSSPEKFRRTQLEIPLYFNYYLRKGRKALVFGLGGAINRNINISPYSVEKTALDQIFTRSAFLSTSLPTPEPELLVYKKYNAYIAGRIHFQYALNPNLHVYVGPHFQTQLTDIYDGQGASRQFPHRIGLELGIRWRKW